MSEVRPIHYLGVAIPQRARRGRGRVRAVGSVPSFAKSARVAKQVGGFGVNTDSAELKPPNLLSMMIGLTRGAGAALRCDTMIDTRR